MLFQEKRMEIKQMDRSKTAENRYEEKNREKEGGWTCSQEALPRLRSPRSRNGRVPGKAFLCVSLKSFRKASLAVETALALPLFFLGIVSMISFMDIYRVQTQHLTQLCEKAKKAGMYAYAAGGSGVEEITLPDVYSYQPVSGIILPGKIRMSNTVKVHTWTGREHAAADGGTHETEAMVYMTQSGSVYHKSLSCSYLNLSVTAVSGRAIASRRNAYGEKYYACETCSRGEKAAGVVYVTEKGNRYHNSASCSGLKRTVRLVKESEAKNAHACSRCG